MLTGLEIYIEKIGWMTQGLVDVNGTFQAVWSTTVYDRDQTGTAVNMHGGNPNSQYSFFSQLQLDNIHPYNYVKECSTITGTCTVQTTPISAPAGGASCAIPPVSATTCEYATGGTGAVSPLITATRNDGYYDTTGAITLQGVRAFDPNMDQWATPDAYSGNVHDPMSQHPYMWNNNNPEQYSDPSGYDALFYDAEEGPTPDEGHATAVNGIVAQVASGNDPNNGHYQTLNDAAKAAQAAYSDLSKDHEVGCAVYCMGGAGTCGYGPASVGEKSAGDYGSVSVDLSPYQGASQVGIWHSHPAGSGTESTRGHAASAQRIFYDFSWLDKQSLTIYTTLTGSTGGLPPGLYSQRYTEFLANNLVSSGEDIDPLPVP
jgi:hypothetical protein